ncbi:MAG: beta-N-acetylhexosaminidase [Armatimonadota bacterium]
MPVIKEQQGPTVIVPPPKPPILSRRAVVLAAAILGAAVLGVLLGLLVFYLLPPRAPLKQAMGKYIPSGPKIIDAQFDAQCRAKAEQVLAGMTLEQKAGQMLMIGFDGKSAKGIEPIGGRCHPGGIVLFRRNIDDASQLTQLIADAQATAYARDGAGLLVAIDQEGGRVAQLLSPLCKRFPANRDWGNVYDFSPESALIGVQAQARETAATFRRYGINMNLAPVLDVQAVEQKTVIGTRSYGDDPEVVATLGGEYIRALQHEDILATAKHFPGHGATLDDSHADLPVIDAADGRIDAALQPFREAIAAGVEAIMTGHIVYSAVDTYPATLSYEWLTRRLRGEMRYQGLIVTDSMGMGAIVKNYRFDQAVVTAVNAGVDIILIATGDDYQRAAGDAIVKAVQNGEITELRLDDSVRRILYYKARHGLLDRPLEHK